MSWYLSGVHDLRSDPSAAVTAEAVIKSPTRAATGAMARQLGHQHIRTILRGLFRGR